MTESLKYLYTPEDTQQTGYYWNSLSLNNRIMPPYYLYDGPKKNRSSFDMDSSLAPPKTSPTGADFIYRVPYSNYVVNTNPADYKSPFIIEYPFNSSLHCGSDFYNNPTLLNVTLGKDNVTGIPCTDIVFKVDHQIIECTTDLNAYNYSLRVSPDGKQSNNFTVPDPCRGKLCSGHGTCNLGQCFSELRFIILKENSTQTITYLAGTIDKYPLLKVNLIISLHTLETWITFATQRLYIPPNSVKYLIDISGWNYTSPLNTLQVIFKTKTSVDPNAPPANPCQESKPSITKGYGNHYEFKAGGSVLMQHLQTTSLLMAV
eukprot:gene12637-14844_t